MSETPNYGLYVTDNSQERFFDIRNALYGTSNSNMVKIDAALNGKAEKSVAISATLFEDGWSGDDAPYIQELPVSGITTDMNGSINVSNNATPEQLNIVRDALLRVVRQEDGKLILAADGLRPTLDIPVTIIILD